MHADAKARILAAQQLVDTRVKLLKHLPATGALYPALIDAFTKLCDEALASGRLTEAESQSIIRFQTRVTIDL